jgi:hypothetical protein
MRKAKGMAASQEELNRQQQELAIEQEDFAVERTKMIASFKANAQQRMTELEATPSPSQNLALCPIPRTWLSAPSLGSLQWPGRWIHMHT